MTRAALAVAFLGLTASVALAQGTEPKVGPHQEANKWFFGLVFALLLIVPFVIVVLLARMRSRSRTSGLPVFTDANFQEEVLESRVPVLVHFARQWNVANAAAKSQTEVVAFRNRGAVTVGTLEISENPQVMERVPGLEPPAYLLFYQGRKLFHRPGLMQAEELQDEIDRALSREGF